MDVENSIIARVRNIYNPNSGFGAVLSRVSDLKDDEKYSVNFRSAFGWTVQEGLSKSQLVESMREKLGKNKKQTVYFSVYEPLKNYGLETEAQFS